MSHGGGIGPPLPTAVVRAALAVRLERHRPRRIRRGGRGRGDPGRDAQRRRASGRAGTASVGAGDVPQMAGMAQVAIGMGRAEYRGEVVSGAEALRRAGIAPLELGGKDGLALISANGVSVGHGGAGRRPGRRGGGGRRHRRGAVDGGDRGQHVGPAARRGAGQAHSRADRGRGPPARAARREPAAGAGRRPVGPGPAVVPGRAAGPRGAARVRHRRPGRGDRRS